MYSKTQTCYFETAKLNLCPILSSLIFVNTIDMKIHFVQILHTKKEYGGTYILSIASEISAQNTSTILFSFSRANTCKQLTGLSIFQATKSHNSKHDTLNECREIYLISKLNNHRQVVPRALIQAFHEVLSFAKQIPLN